MKRVIINLHPHAEKKEAKIIVLMLRYMPYCVVAALGFLGINIVLFFIGGMLRLPLSGLEAEWKKLAPQVEKVTAMKNEATALAQQKKEYEELLHREVSVSRLLEEVYTSLPRNIWFQSIALNEGDLTFLGYVVQWKEDYLVSLDKFITDIKGKEYFSEVFGDNIELQRSRKIEYNKVDVVAFTVRAQQ